MTIRKRNEEGGFWICGTRVRLSIHGVVMGACRRESPVTIGCTAKI